MKKRTLLIFTSMIFLMLCGAATEEEFVDKKKAQKLDHLIKKRLLQKGIELPTQASDDVFRRRAFLSVIGRISTEKEAAQFSDLSSASARQKLIDYLYNHEGYTSHMSNWAMDLLRLRDRVRGNLETSALTEWVRGAIRENKPWDETAYELLTTKGNAWANSGASGYYAIDPGMQNDNLAATAFAFLGVKMECAQCHDDPYQEWERMDFYELSAFVDGGTGLGKGMTRKARKMFEANPEKYDMEGIGQISKLAQYLNKYTRFGIPDQKGAGNVKIPKDWQYEDGKPGDLIFAKTPFGKRHKIEKPNWDALHAINSSDHDHLSKEEKKKLIQSTKAELKEKKKKFEAENGKGLHLFGEWLISDETPQFAYTISARMWERVMGFSLTETLGQYEEVASSEYPVIWEYIAQLIKEYEYDLNRFQKTLASTRAFQAVNASRNVTQATQTAEQTDEALAGRPLLRLSAEQIWDSLLVLIVDDPEALPKRALRTQLNYRGYDLGSIKATIGEIENMSREEYTDYVFALYDDMVEGKVNKVGKQKKSKSNMKRASELESPINKNHFLYTFGQSGRSVTDGATKEGSVSQALLLFNGEVQKYVVHNKRATLNRKLATLESPEEKIRSIFQNVLSRQPSDAELNMCIQEVAETDKKAYQNITSALISSQEFLFLR